MEIESFSIIRQIGEGTYGNVYEVTIPGSDKKYALKKIIISTKEEFQKFQKYIDREIEINGMISTSSHPNLVTFIDHRFRADTNTLEILMELCDDSLDRQLDEKKFDEKDAASIVKDIISGMKALNERKIIHRDLKPENILIRDGVYKISDFGLSKVLLNLDTPILHTRGIGTPLYESLENLTSRPYSSKHDVWSLGVIYYQILFGNLPMGEYRKDFNTKDELILRIKNLKIGFPSPISPQLEELLRGMLGITEADRLDWDSVFKKFEDYLALLDI